jgi:hypothetical protein
MEYYTSYSGTNVPSRWGQQALPKRWFYLPGDKASHSKWSYLYTHCDDKLRLTRRKILVGGNSLLTLPPFARHHSRLHIQNHYFWRNKQWTAKYQAVTAQAVWLDYVLHARWIVVRFPAGLRDGSFFQRFQKGKEEGEGALTFLCNV